MLKHQQHQSNKKATTLSNGLKAFTIVELLIVVVVIGILAAITIVSYSGITSQASVASLKTDLDVNSRKLQLYYTQYGSYPTALDGSNCPSAPTVDSNYCLKLSPGNTLSTYTGAINTFTLNIAKGTLLWKVTESTPPASATAFNLTLNTSSGGTVTGSGTYETGSVVTITATPSTNYSFTSWTGDTGCSGTATHTITITANVTCTAVFSEILRASCLEILNNGQSTGNGLYTIKPLASPTSFSVYCDMTTNGGGWVLAASWSVAQEWTKASISSEGPFGETPLNGVSSRFGDMSINDFRILASDSVSTTGPSAYADWFYHYNTATTWKSVWAPSSNTGGSQSHGYMSTTPRQSLKPFDYSYNIKYSYQVAQTYNNLSDWGYTAGTTNGCLPNYWYALTTAGGTFGVYDTNSYGGSNGTSCSSYVLDGSLGICPSNIPSCVTGQDTANNNVKIGYDDSTALMGIGNSSTAALAELPGVNVNTKLWWFIR